MWWALKYPIIINRVGLEKAKKELAESIQKGVSFIKNWTGAIDLVFLDIFHVLFKIMIP